MTEQLTFEQLTARIDPAEAQRAVARALVFLGGQWEWDSDTFQAVQDFVMAAKPLGLPSVGDQGTEGLTFWGTLCQEVGFETDLDTEVTFEDAFEGSYDPHGGEKHRYYEEN